MDKRLATPRRREPRLAVPAGSVAIGGEQTGVYPSVSPGGWQIIGQTSLQLFDPARDPAALLSPGDTVHFLNLGKNQ
jgi:KipI family sensor histidine kinase inhibitor